MSPPIEAPLAGDRYRFRALSSAGAEESGIVIAASREDARSQVIARGLLPTEIRLGSFLGARSRGPSLADAALGLRLLATLVASGLMLERALGIFASVAPPSWDRAQLGALREAVRGGESLALGLRTAGFTLPDYATGIIAAGESSGSLDGSLRDASRLLDQSASQRAAVRGALAYPTLLLVAGLASVTLLVGVVLPRFAELLEDVGQQLPLSARLLLAFAHLASRWWWLAATVVTLLVAGATSWYHRTPEARRRIHAWLLGVPIIGPLRLALAGGRLGASLAAMLGAGLPMASALTHASFASGDAEVDARVRAARTAVVRGVRLSAALRDDRAIRDGAVRLVQAGEVSGELTEMIRTAGAIENEWALARLRWLTSLLEPGLILLFGGAIAFVAAALLQAVYSIRPTP